MINQFVTNTVRPSRTKEKKDMDYHCRYARWVVNRAMSDTYRTWLAKCAINWSFFKGGRGQWVLEEDLEGFFLDESGGIKNRIRMSQNLIKPMVNQFVGNAVRLNFNAQAESYNDHAQSFMDKEVQRMNWFHSAEEANPKTSSVIRDRIPLGNSRMETEELVRANPQDVVQENANALLTAIKKDCDTEEIQVRMSRYLALSGLALYEGGEKNGSYVGDAQMPWQYFWDDGARKPDLSDSEFMGKWEFSDAVSLIETYERLSKTEVEAIENFAIRDSQNVFQKIFNNHWNASPSRIPVYHCYWKDLMEVEYAWIKDKNGFVVYEHINNDMSEYTSKDRVTKAEVTPEQLAQTDDKLHAFIYVDVIRYCKFIPKEDVSYNGLQEDIVLEWGTLKYGETYSFAPDTMRWPFKAYTWHYENGELLTPIDDAIDPQRMMNRMLSIQESHINNSHGSVPVIARETMTEEGEEADIEHRMNNSKPVFLEAAAFGGVNNAVGQIPSNLGKDSGVIDGVLNQMKTAMADMTGVNEAMTGTMGSKGALVGVIEEQINRGSIVQEPFYFALTKCMTSVYEHMMTVGKKIYADNPRKLALMVGDKGKDILVFLRDIDLEDFRLSVDRVEGQKTMIDQGTEAAMLFLQMGMLPPEVASQLFGKATVDQVYNAFRKYSGMAAMAKAEQGQQQQEALAAQSRIENANNERQFALEEEKLDSQNDNAAADRMTEYLKSAERNETAVARDQMKLAANV